jgi:signal transduction histidine kinase/HAMP domain-containing protein
MRLHTRIVAGYLVSLFLIFAVSVYSNHEGRQLLLKDAGRHSQLMARQLIRHIDHELDTYIDFMASLSRDGTIRAFLAESNLHFAALQDREATIALQGRIWRGEAAAQSMDTPFSKTLLERFALFSETRYGTAQQPEILVTNRYGAVVAQTQKTRDYSQADESWWQHAINDGVCIEDSHAEDGAQPYGTAIAMRIDGPNGSFAGVIKAMVPIMAIIRNARINVQPYEATKVELFTRKGIRLFSSGTGALFADVSDQPFFKKLKGQSGCFRDTATRPVQMIAWAGSEDIESLRELGWILALEHDEDEILANSSALQKKVFLIAAIVGLLALAAAWLTAGSIAAPILQLRDAAQAVASGNLKKQVSVNGRDELAQLACSFNRMTTVLDVTCMQLRQRIAASEMAQVLLKENEHRLFQFLDAMPVGVLIIDHTGAPYFANQAAKLILGKGIVPEAGPDRMAEVYQLYIAGTREPYPKEKMPIIQALAGQLATADDMEVHHPDRTTPIMMWASPVFNVRGSVDYATAAFSDMSEQKEAENKLKATALELKRSNAELEQFAYIASHDLQEPLRKVGSYMELVADRYRELLDQDGREFIDYAVDGARRMKVMINDLLVYSRVGTKGKPFAPTNTMKVMQDVLIDMELTIQDNNARITFDSLPVVTADESQLHQLFSNLIGNAVKYRGQDPPQIHVTARRQSRAWRFCVQDNGIGIEPRFFDRIFQIFQRLHGPGRYNGTGIGLAVCKKIVERHGGSIEVESIPGQGSSFYFTISDLKEN